MDIKNLSIEQLKDLLQQIPAEIKFREKEVKANVLKELKSLAGSHGFSLSDLVKGEEAEARSKSSPVKPKYRNPFNAEETWAGRGRQPRWVRDHLAQGKSIDTLLI